MKAFCIVALVVSGVLAGVSILSIPIWLLGVPGVEGSYARGWKFGLIVVFVYPVVWGCIFTFWRIARKHVEVGHESALNLWIGAGSLIALLVAVGLAFYAFKMMSRT